MEEVNGTQKIKKLNKTQGKMLLYLCIFIAI